MEHKEGAPPNDLPPGWEEMKDPKSGKLFYVNHNSKITTWDRPGVAQKPVLPPSYREVTQTQMPSTVAPASFALNKEQTSRIVIGQKVRIQKRYEEINANEIGTVTSTNDDGSVEAIFKGKKIGFDEDEVSDWLEPYEGESNEGARSPIFAPPANNEKVAEPYVLCTSPIGVGQKVRIKKKYQEIRAFEVGTISAINPDGSVEVLFNRRKIEFDKIEIPEWLEPLGVQSNEVANPYVAKPYENSGAIFNSPQSQKPSHAARKSAYGQSAHGARHPLSRAQQSGEYGPPAAYNTKPVAYQEPGAYNPPVAYQASGASQAPIGYPNKSYEKEPVQENFSVNPNPEGHEFGVA